MDISISEPESVIKSIASTKVKEDIISLTELTDKIQNESDQIVDIEMDNVNETENTLNKKVDSSSSSSSSTSSGSSSSTSSTQSEAVASTSSTIIAPPPPPPVQKSPDTISDHLSNSDLHKNIETNIEKILDCFCDDKITDSPLSPPPASSVVTSSITPA